MTTHPTQGSQPPTPLGHQDAPGDRPVHGSIYDIGLPYPIWDTDPSPAEASARTATRQGRQVHAAIARLAPLVPLVGEDHQVIEAAIASIVTGRENGNLPRARIRVSGLVRQYLRVFFPQTCTFEGAEVPVHRGRADLLWSHPGVGWFYDEIKTMRTADVLTPPVVDQVLRYAEAGRQEFGDDFAGVRIITLGHEEAALQLSPDGSFTALRESPLSPTSLAKTTSTDTKEDPA